MGVLNLDTVEPGMVLAADVKDRTGRVLLAAGVTITEKHLRIFKMWGVTEADVRGVVHAEVVARATASLDPESVRSAEEVTALRFRHTPADHPAVKELFRLATLRMVEAGKENRHGT
jgi:hypothetical protein